MMMVFTSLVLALTNPAEPSAEVKQFDGVWAFESFGNSTSSQLTRVWSSQLKIEAGKFSITKVHDMDNPFSGSFTVDPAQKHIDFSLNTYDLRPAAPLSVAACKIPGLYRYAKDEITIAVQMTDSAVRPKNFEANGREDVILKLKRLPTTMKEFPKEVTITVLGSDGQPKANVISTHHMSLDRYVEFRKGEETIKMDLISDSEAEIERKLALLPSAAQGLRKRIEQIKNPGEGSTWNPKTGWSYHGVQKTDAKGQVKLAYDSLRSGQIFRSEEKQQIALLDASPIRLASGEVTIQLEPECVVKIPVSCSEIAKDGSKIRDGFNCYIQMPSGQRILYCHSAGEDLLCVLPPGKYSAGVYGSDYIGKKTMPFEVPAEHTEYRTATIDLPATGLHRLIGKPAKELQGIVGWKGEPVKIADQKGKVVILEFWGYWCGPCVYSMPELFKIRKQFTTEEVVIIGIHLDGNGEVTNAKELDAKLEGIKKKIWADQDLPFPSALFNGKPNEDGARGIMAELYGVTGYPTTIIIDTKGNVVGKDRIRSADDMAPKIRQLLQAK
ncbi:MAG: redoxin domain-containing protein [Fimbriiglobus sp.]